VLYSKLRTKSIILGAYHGGAGVVRIICIGWTGKDTLRSDRSWRGLPDLDELRDLGVKGFYPSDLGSQASSTDEVNICGHMGDMDRMNFVL
jgi:hypothetical protein